MRKVDWKIFAAIAVLAAVLGIGASRAPAGSAHGSKPSVSALVDSSPRASVLAKGISIHSSRHAAARHPAVVYSVALPHAQNGDRIKVAGAAAPSYCSSGDIKRDHAGSPCRLLANERRHSKRNYKVRIEALIYSARTASRPSNPATEHLPGGIASNTCTLARHHCPLTARSKATLKHGQADHVNLELFAWTSSRRWRGGDRLALDCVKQAGHCSTAPTNSPFSTATGRMLQTGQLGVVLLGTSGNHHVHATSTRIDDSSIAVNNRDYAARTVVHSARLDGLEPGDVISATGAVDVTGHGFDHFAGSYWFLTTAPDKRIAVPTGPEEYLSGRNGVNCLGSNGGLTGTSSGFCAAPATLPVMQDGIGTVPQGAPSTMYLNYVVLASDASRPAGVTPTADIGNGRFRVDCYSPSASGTPCSIAVP